MRCKKAAQGLSEENAFVCFALAVHKASERILFKDHKSFFYLLWDKVKKKKKSGTEM